MRRRASRWATPFGSWVGDQGVRWIVDRLAQLGEPVTNKAVYSWISGAGRPRMETAVKLVRLSSGSLTIEAIMQQRESADTGGGVHGTARSERAGNDPR